MVLPEVERMYARPARLGGEKRARGCATGPWSDVLRTVECARHRIIAGHGFRAFVGKDQPQVQRQIVGAHTTHLANF